MTVNDRPDQLDIDHVFVQPVHGTPDLVHWRRDIRAVLARFDEVRVADVVLVAVVLAGDAFRYGAPPVTLRLRITAHDAGLRLEVQDHGPPRSNPRPFGYRASLLDRIANQRGLEQADDGTTTVWAEIPWDRTATRSAQPAA